jgi:hypothetical protein
MQRYAPKVQQAVQTKAFPNCLSFASLPKEAPAQEENDNKRQRRNGPILLQQQLPIDPHRRALILERIIFEPTAHIPHPLQTIPSVQQVLDILRHHFVHVFELVIQAIESAVRAAVLIRLLAVLEEALEFCVGVGAQAGG